MKKNVLVFGLILGILLCANMLYMVNLCYTNATFKSNAVIGYTTLLVIFSMVFFGIRNYRNKQLDGFISFWKAFRTGTLIALTASALYVIVWLFSYYLFVPDWMEVYTRHVLRDTPPEELAAKVKEMERFTEMYRNPAFVVLSTFMEVFPIGLIVALVSALVLKRKNLSQA